MDKLIFRSFSKVVAVSTVVRNCLIKEGCAEYKIVVINNGIKLNNFLSLRHSKKQTSHNGLIRIGVVARLETWKGVQHTIEAVLELNDFYEDSNCRYEIVLAGTEFKNIENNLRQSLNLAINKKVLKRIPWQSDMATFYKGIDVLIHVPETRLAEAFGMVFIEGLTSGIPCIFTESGVLVDSPTLLAGAYIVDYKSSQSISKALLKATDVVKYNLPRNLIPAYNLKEFELSYVVERYKHLFDKFRMNNSISS